MNERERHESRSAIARGIVVGLATIALAANGVTACAQDADYPNKPVRLIIPQSPGAASDVLGRIFAFKFGEMLGQPIVIDNKAGAGGIIGAETAAKSAPDGYTVLLGASAWITISPHAYRKISYDALNDFAPVSLFAIGQNMLVFHPSLQISNLKDLVALMKEKPGLINMASAGVGSASHLAGLLLNTIAGVSALHVPYKGANQSVGAVLSGEAHWSFTPMQAPLSHVRSGKLKALVVGGNARSPIFPDLPTVAESGYPDYYSATWYGVMMPKGTPPAIIDKLHAAVVKAVATPQLREQIASQGAEARANTPAEFAKFIREDFDRLGKVVKLAGVKAD